MIKKLLLTVITVVVVLAITYAIVVIWLGIDIPFLPF